MPEKRRHQRFHPKVDAYIAFAPPDLPNLTKLGKLLNISAGGICFNYMSRNKETDGLRRLDILMEGAQPIKINQLPCAVVYDIESSNTSYRNMQSTRSCGVQFDQLPAELLSAVDAFISNYTDGQSIAGT